MRTRTLGRSAYAASVVKKLFLLLAIAVTLTVSYWDRSHPVRHSSDAPLASAHYEFREHGDGRTVSEIELELLARDEDGGELVLRASSIGPLIKPPPGWAWVTGENPITAREMLQLVESESARVVTRRLETGEERVGNASLGRFEHFTERKLQPDGTVEDIGPTKPALPTSIRFATGTLPEGAYVTRLVVNDVTRLTIEFELDGSTGRISKIEDSHSELREELTP